MTPAQRLWAGAMALGAAVLTAAYSLRVFGVVG